MTDKTNLYLTLPEAIARMARMAAARRGVNLSDYVADLIEKDCKTSGIATLVTQAVEEVSDAR